MTKHLTKVERAKIQRKIEILKELDRRDRQRIFFKLFPDEDTIQKDGSIIYAREKYAKHLEFFKAGKDYRERAAICANRIGKSFGMGGYEVSTHSTGLYPNWWDGKVFERPTRTWAAGKTNETTRDIVQKTLFGEITHASGKKGFDGTGVIPGDKIGAVTWKQGVQDLADTVKIKHSTGNWSVIGLKSYQQGRGSFEGTEQDVIWLDEEPPADIYGECLIRTATTNGVTMLTFTPLEGMSDVVQSFLDKPGA